jgi:hypothetical protein
MNDTLLSSVWYMTYLRMAVLPNTHLWNNHSMFSYCEWSLAFVQRTSAIHVPLFFLIYSPMNIDHLYFGVFTWNFSQLITTEPFLMEEISLYALSCFFSHYYNKTLVSNWHSPVPTVMHKITPTLDHNDLRSSTWITYSTLKSQNQQWKHTRFWIKDNNKWLFRLRE